MKKHIFLYITFVSVLFSVISGIMMFQISMNVYTRTMRSNLIDTAYMAKADHLDSPTQITDYFKNTAGSNMRVSFFDNAGNTLADSFNDSSSMENHSGRKEFLEAIAGKTGEDIRTSATDGRKYMYLAIRYDDQMILRLSIPYEEYDRLLSRMVQWVVTAIVIFTMVALFLSLLLSHWIVRPIENFQNTMSRFAHGNYTVRAQTQKIKELIPLATNFNKMADSLVTTISELQNKSAEINNIITNMNEGFIAINEKHRVTLINPRAMEYLKSDCQTPLGHSIFTLSRDTDFIRTITHTLESGQSGILDMEIDGRDIRVFAGAVENGGLVLFFQDVTPLKHAERMRAEFTANVSHELKTPLTSIRGFAETLKDGALDNREVAYNFLDIISIEAERLSVLINDILQISEIEAMHIDVDIKPFLLRPCVEEVVRLLSGKAQEQNISLSIRCDDDLIVRANADRIKQLLLNLVDNAIKYGSENGHVLIDVSRMKQNAIIRVQDDGIGISAEDLSRIFERFYRSEKSRSKKKGGTGLGLAIVKHIVNLYKGTVEVNSEYGKGTEFIVTMPVAANAGIPE